MRRGIIKHCSWFLILILLFTSVPADVNVKAANEAFYIFVWVLDENGKPYTGKNYEPGFIYPGGFPSHSPTNDFGSALISTYKSANDLYNYFSYGTDDSYENYSGSFHITEQHSIVKIQLAKKGSGKTTTGTLTLPDDPAYPQDPLNPAGAPEKKVNIHGVVRNENGGIPNASVTIKNPSKPEEFYSMTTTTDSNGYYYLSNVDEKRFGTYQIMAVKDGVTILTAGTKKEYYSGSVYTPLDANFSYDFGEPSSVSVPTYAISVAGGTAVPTAAPAGTKVHISADTPIQKQFLNWSSSSADVIFENAASPVTCFIMPGHAVSVQANNTDIPEGGGDQPADKPNPPEPGSTESPQPKPDPSEPESTESDSLPDGEQASGISLDKSTLTLGKGKCAELTAEVTPEEAADELITWNSSDTGVAVVEDGIVKGVNKGEAVITASTANGKTAKCSVTVAAVTLNAVKAPLQKGKSSKGLAIESKYPANDKAVKWTTSNKKIVQVDAKSGKIKGIAKGTAKITVTMKSGAAATCKVTVQSKKVVTRKVTLDKKKLTILTGKKVLLTAKKDPVTAPEKLKWSSSNQKVAAVNAKGKVTAKKPGKAVITVKSANGKKAVCRITVP